MTEKKRTKKAKRIKDYKKKKNTLNGWCKLVNKLRSMGVSLSDCPGPPVKLPKSKKVCHSTKK